MVTHKSVLVLLFMLVPLFVGLARAQEYLYQKYEDRKEGILKEKKLVAGEKLELISAAVTSQEAPTQSDQYCLTFFVEDSDHVQVVVQALVPQIQRLYKMEPIFTDYPNGLWTFCWPATIPTHYNLTLDKLLPLAKLRGASGIKIAPVLLYSGDNRNATPRYRFCVVPSGSVSTLNYHIYASNATTSIYSGSLRDLPSNEQAFLDWDGHDQTGTPLKSGWYKLIIEVTFKALPGMNPRVGNFQYEFYHYTEIFRGTGAMQ